MVTVAGWGVTVQVDKETVITPDMVPSEPYEVVLQKVASELHPKVRNHGEGPY